MRDFALSFEGCWYYKDSRYQKYSRLVTLRHLLNKHHFTELTEKYQIMLQRGLRKTYNSDYLLSNKSFEGEKGSFLEFGPQKNILTQICIDRDHNYIQNEEAY